jgi:predicted small integral membrane protein
MAGYVDASGYRYVWCAARSSGRLHPCDGGIPRFYIFAIILSVLCGVFGVLGGVALLRQRTSRLAIIAAFLSLSELLIGITLGVYTLLTIFRAHRAE